MKLDSSFLIVLIFIGTGAAAGYAVKSGVVHVPVLTDMARNSRQQSAAPHAWPPKLGQAYPDLQLTALNGEPLKLSDYRGKLLLIEPISMSCKACQSFSGADEDNLGPFGADRGGAHQRGLLSLETYTMRFAGVDFEDPRLVYVQVLFYDLEGKRPPSLEDANAWAKHFNLNRSNIVVAIADEQYISQTTRAMIPSFQLVDQDFQLRFDAGKPPRQDLYKELLPALKGLINGGAQVAETESDNVTAIDGESDASPEATEATEPTDDSSDLPSASGPADVGVDFHPDTAPTVHGGDEADFDKFDADRLPAVPAPVPAIPGEEFPSEA